MTEPCNCSGCNQWRFTRPRLLPVLDDAVERGLLTYDEAMNVLDAFDSQRGWANRRVAPEETTR